MIGKLERREVGYRTRLRSIVTYAYIHARGHNGGVTLEELAEKFGGMINADIVSYMNEEISQQIFKREITGMGIVYRLTAKYRYASFDDVNKFITDKLKKKK